MSTGCITSPESRKGSIRKNDGCPLRRRPKVATPIRIGMNAGYRKSNHLPPCLVLLMVYFSQVRPHNHFPAAIVNVLPGRNTGSHRGVLIPVDSSAKFCRSIDRTEISHDYLQRIYINRISAQTHHEVSLLAHGGPLPRACGTVSRHPGRNGALLRCRRSLRRRDRLLRGRLCSRRTRRWRHAAVGSPHGLAPPCGPPERCLLPRHSPVRCLFRDQDRREGSCFRVSIDPGDSSPASIRPRTRRTSPALPGASIFRDSARASPRHPDDRSSHLRHPRLPAVRLHSDTLTVSE